MPDERDAAIEQLKTVLTEVTAKLTEQDKILKDLAEPPGMLGWAQASEKDGVCMRRWSVHCLEDIESQFYRDNMLRRAYIHQ